jgi:hypothetical protein
MILQLDPPLPLISPNGKCFAHLVIDYGQESDLLWVCFQNETGECWTWPNSQIRLQPNITLDRLPK